MAVAVGIDVAKEFGRAAIVLAETGKTLVSRRVDNDPDSIEELIEHLHRPAPSTLAGLQVIFVVVRWAASLDVHLRSASEDPAGS